MDDPAVIRSSAMKTLVVGWFSFEQGHATAGDLLARDVACLWLQQTGHAYDVAVAPPFQGGLDWRSVEPKDYSQVIFVCGPFERGELEAEFLERFGRHRLIGLNLSMQLPLDEWNPFDFLIERDSSIDAHPDMVFLSNHPHVPVVGVCLVEPYPEALVEVANEAIQRLTASKEMSIVQIDTRLDTNETGLRSPAEIETLIARMDALITTRLHGMVLALKNGVPVVAIDPKAGGAKIRRQAELIGWPVIFDVDAFTDDALREALNYCLTESARAKAQECRNRAINMVEEMRGTFISTLTHPDDLEKRYLSRITAAAHTSNVPEASHGASEPQILDTTAVPNKLIFVDLVGNAKGLLKRVLRWT
jgi:Polysaccharide pyruvyl transferase